MLDLTESKVYEFEDFRLDAKSHRLFQRETGKLVPLQPKAADLLLALVENRGRLLTKDELIETVWGGAFVEESNISQTIFVLRKTLGDNKKEPRYILTVPQRGYQFIADVSEIHAGDEILNALYLSDATPSGRATKSQKRPVFWIAGAVTVVAAVLLITWGGRRDSPAQGVRTLAVMPFQRLGETTDEAIQFGMADTLITRLSRMRSIVVRPTSSVLKYAGERPATAEVGQELQVDAVLEGSIQQVADRVRVNVQLVSTSTGGTIWADKFDTRFTDVFELQDAISQGTLSALTFELSDEERRSVMKHTTENGEAYQDYVQGRYLWNKRTPEGLSQAMQYFRHAIEKDPQFARAHAGLADCYSVLPYYTKTTTKEAFPQAKAAALRAVEIDDSLAEAHVSLALMLVGSDWDFASAESEYKRAIELNPNYATAHHWYAILLSERGKFAEAVIEAERAHELDPQSVAIAADKAAMVVLAGRSDEGLRLLVALGQSHPESTFIHSYLGAAYLADGRPAEAADEFGSLRATDDSSLAIAGHAIAHARLGDSAKVQQALDELKRRPGDSSYAYSIAIVYAEIGDRDNALEWLERAFETREDQIVTLIQQRSFDTLATEPRFVQLTRKMGLAG